jgi:hypothetical protein
MCLMSLSLLASLLGPSAAWGAESSPSPSLTGAAVEADSNPGELVPVGTLNWVRNTKGKGFAGDAQVADLLEVGNGKVLMCGYVADQFGGPSAALWSTSNLKKWTPVKWSPSPGSQCFGLATWPGGLVAVGGGDTGHLWTSTNGKKWKDQPIAATASLNDVALQGDELLVIGDAGVVPETAPVLWSSSDGVDWKAHPIAAAGSARHLAVTPEGVLVVAGKLLGPNGGTPVVWRSSDGSAWDEVALEGVPDGRSFVPTLRMTPVGLILTLVTPADGGPSGGSAWVSTDGSAWQRVLVMPEGSLSAIGTFGPEVVLIGPGGTWHSTDGTTWEMTADDTFEPYDVLAGIIALSDGRWLAGGDTFDPPRPGVATWVGTPAP